MRKLSFFFIVLFCCLSPSLFAKKVLPDRAQAAVSHFIAGFSGRGNSAEIQSMHEVSWNGHLVYYVFSLNAGFVLLSADDCVQPVLGYSWEHPFPLNEQQHPALKSWLQHYARQIVKAKQADESVKKAWRSLDNFEARPSQPKAIAPLLLSSWGQGYPYNVYCPADPEASGGHTYVGCVATALAQILYYYRYPVYGQGYKSYEHPKYGTLSANFGQTHYAWNEMLDLVHSPTPAVANLCYHIGVALEMNYSPSGSGANSMQVPEAMRTFFGYSETAQYVRRLDYEADEWAALLRAQLDARQPVFYRGVDGFSGHAFVCDGYEGDQFFHFNWGWKGNANGYYFVDALTPGGYDFSYDQAAVIDLVPVANYPLYCTGDTLRSAKGSLTDGSGNFPYASNFTCQWLIEPEGESFDCVMLRFDRLDTEAGYDEVSIYAGSDSLAPLVGRFSGTQIPQCISVNTPRVCVVFHTNESITASGWQLSYRAFQGDFCPDHKILTALRGWLSDGSHDWDYTNNSYGEWLLAPEGEELDSIAAISLVFHHLDTELAHDFVTVYNGADTLSPIIGRYSGSTLPAEIVVPNNQALLTFTANDTLTSEGFGLVWEAQLPVYCQDTVILTQARGNITDGSQGKRYNNNSSCFWLIEPRWAESIKIRFSEMEIEPNYDQLRIYDATKNPVQLLARYSGYSLPPETEFQTQRLLLHFKSDEELVYQGFSLEYEAGNIGIEASANTLMPQLFPVPATDFLQLRIPVREERIFRAQLITNCGQIIPLDKMEFAPGQRCCSIPLKTVSSGVYVLRLSDGLNLIQKKFIVNK